MNFVFIEVNDIEMIFPHFLKTAQIFVADGMAFLKGCSFEFSGTNLGHIVG
jgi:hypothetical protein